MQSQSQQISNPLLIKSHEENQVKKDSQPKVLPPAPFLALFQYTTNSQKVKLIIGSISALAAGIVFPFFLIYFADITTIFDDRQRQKAADRGLTLLWQFMIVGGLTWLTNTIGLFCWNSVGASQAVRIKGQFFKTLLEQQIKYYDENDPNKIVTKVTTSITAIQTATGQKMSILITTVVTSCASMFLAFFKCWQMSLVLTGCLPALLIAAIFFMKALILNSQRQKVSYEQASSRTEQALSQIRTVKSLVGQLFELKIFKQKLLQGMKKSVKYCLMSASGNGFIIFVFVSMYSLGFWYGKKLIIDNPAQYNAATILSTFFCFIVGGSSIGQISPFFKNIADGRVAMAQLFQLMYRQKSLEQPKNGKKISKIKQITLKGINFEYKKDQPILKNINITFKQNQVSAIVGQSGCGKSTIIQLLMRFYDASSGQLAINEVDIKNINMNNYRRKIGFVGQQPVLFAMSIAQNLKLANPNLTQQQMIEALKKANAWQFVSKTQKKLDTYVGSSGTQFSGGQKQRIAIARALCKNPHILILDEATSALDRKNERQIQQTLRSLQQNGITTIVIAHRLSTIRNADKIYVLQNGSLVEEGTHDELLRLQKVYAQLVKSQVAAADKLQQQNELILKNIKSQRKQQQQILVQKKQQKQQIPKQKQDKVFRKLVAFQKQNIGWILLGIVGSLVAGLVWPFFNWVFSGILQLMMNPAQNQDQLNLYCIYILLVAAAGGSMTLLYTFAFGLASQKLVYKIRVDMFEKLLKLPVSFYDKKANTAGAITSKLATDAYQIRNMVSGIIGVMCLNIATIGASLAFGLYYSWKITLITLSLSPLITISGSINMKVIMKLTSKSQQTQKYLASLMSDSVCNMKTVKSLGRPKTFLSQFQNKLNQLDKVNKQKHLKSSILQGMSKGMIMVVQGIIFYIAAVLFQDGQVEDGRAVFTAVMSVIFAAMGVGQNSQFMPDTAKAKLAGAGIFDILESQDEQQLSINNNLGSKQQIPVIQKIQFKNITFKYPERQKIILQNLNLIFKGQKVALVGHSGSGKSTVIQLLMRFYQPDSGQILINDINIKQFALYKYREKIGLVSQQPILFMGSVESNIKYNKQITPAELKQALDIACASKFINEWQQGLQKQVGQKGTQVSGGQKQRIALARCLIRNPSFYLFDQYTSALDADTEKIVFDNMKDVLKRIPSITVAHRMSTIEDSNKIFVFKDGKIIEEGSYLDLIALKKHFYSLAKDK